MRYGVGDCRGDLYEPGTYSIKRKAEMADVDADPEYDPVARFLELYIEQHLPTRMVCRDHRNP